MSAPDDPAPILPQVALKHPLSAPSVKIQRARKHLAELEAEVASFIIGKPIKFTVEAIEANGERTFIFNMHMGAVPETLGAIIGDIIHNLRAALDLTACEMVRAAQQSDVGVYFPFSESAEELDGIIRRRHFDRAGAEAVALLQSLKPYRNGNTSLRSIHDLDIHDKHRALIPNVMSAASPIIQMWEDDGTPNPRVIGDPNAPTEIKIVFPSEVGPAGQELLPTLHELVQLVERIVEAFRALANRDAGA
ncbi:hypothetical protein SAMN05519104_1649 [Rhizobiales bacterium GAS188]|nr:hypothetical protein SAMN05519104_1649 [Rhizobiales bacterium GAS188]